MTYIQKALRRKMVKANGKESKITLVKSTISAIAICIQANLPFILKDKPGTGKSKTIEAICRALTRHCITFIAGVHEPADIGGYPCVIDGKLQFLPAPFLRKAKELAGAGENVFIFADELTNAPPAMQGALMRLMLERQAGELDLNMPNISMGAAANPPEQAAEGWDLRPPLANRLVHFQWELSVDGWVRGMTSGWPLPWVPILAPNWQKEIPQARAIFASWIHNSRANFHTLTESNGSGAWASPRSLDMASRLLAATRSLDLEDTDPLPIELIAGCIGEGPTLEFASYRKNVDLPDPEVLITDPKKFKLPQRGDVTYTILNSVVAAYLENRTKERWAGAFRVLARAAELGAPDIGASLVDTLAKWDNMPREFDEGIDIPEEIEEFQKIMSVAGLQTGGDS